MNNAYSALLTELGIIITEDGNVKRSFPFDNPVSDYLAIKSGRTPKSCREMPQYLESMNSAISTGDESLFEILKKASIDTQMLEGSGSRECKDCKTAACGIGRPCIRRKGTQSQSSGDFAMKSVILKGDKDIKQCGSACHTGSQFA